MVDLYFIEDILKNITGALLLLFVHTMKVSNLISLSLQLKSNIVWTPISFNAGLD